MYHEGVAGRRSQITAIYDCAKKPRLSIFPLSRRGIHSGILPAIAAGQVLSCRATFSQVLRKVRRIGNIPGKKVHGLPGMGSLGAMQREAATGISRRTRTSLRPRVWKAGFLRAAIGYDIPTGGGAEARNGVLRSNIDDLKKNQVHPCTAAALGKPPHDISITRKHRITVSTSKSTGQPVKAPV